MSTPAKKVEPPGWNDPPMLDNTNPPPKSRIQNKRIGFSFNSAAPVNNTALIPTNVPSTCLPDLYNTGKENFDKVLGNLPDDQVRKIIENLLEMWQSGGLTVVAQQCLCELSTCLVERDIVKSNQLHFKLCMNASPQMASYWQAVKTLIMAVSKDV